MLKAKNIIYGHCTYTTPNKPKYLISLYRSEDLNIIAVFPTSKSRAGTSNPIHGCNKRDNIIVSYVFEAGRPIGTKYQSEEDFSFPLQTVIPFDYCFREDTQDNILKTFNSPKVVGVLSDREYVDIVYSFLHSPYTPEKYKEIFDKILRDYFGDK
ncbi:MAG: hypothetical protein J1E37_06045 [Prevotella sp.]|nr:hypothetical protein [Prevotella sp.]